MSPALDPIPRMRAGDPARELPVDDLARAALWRTLLASAGEAADAGACPRRTRPRDGRRPTARVTIAIVALVLLLAAAALAAGGVIELGSPARLPFSTFSRADEGDGTVVPGSVHMIGISAADPAGGPDWGMRVLGTTRGEGCIQIGRIVDGKLGALGQDDAFGNDGRFHELPVSSATEVNGCALLDARGRLYTNVTADERPASAWIGTGGRLGGCVPATAGPYEKGLRLTPQERARGLRPSPICPQADLRNIYYGLLGPQAKSITYLLGSQRHTLATVGSAGAYMFVTRASPHQLLNFANAGTADIVPVDGPIREIHYRDGSTCHLTSKSWIGGAYACTPSLSEPVGYVDVGTAPTHAQLATPLHVRIGRGRFGRAILISFIARLPVTDARRTYSLRWRSPGMPSGAYGGTATQSDIRAGSTVHMQIALESAFSKHKGNLRPGIVHGTVSLQQALGAGGIEGPGSVSVPVGSFAIRVP